MDPTVKLNPWLQKILLMTEHPVVQDDSENIDASPDNHRKSQVGLIMSPVLRIAEFLQYDPKHLDEIVLLHRDMQRTCTILKEKLSEIVPDPQISTFINLPKLPPIKVASKRLYEFYQKMNGLFLTLEVMLNGILQAYNPEDVTLLARNSQICQEVVELSLAAQDLRPLGAGMIPVCLSSAWAATSDSSSRALLEETWSTCWAGTFDLNLIVAGQQSEMIYKQLRRAVLRAQSIFPRLSCGERGDWDHKDVLISATT